MRNLNIFKKLFFSHTTIGLVAIVTFSFIVYVLVGEVLFQRSLDQLSSINMLKKELVETYFFRSQQNLQALSVEDKFLHIHTKLTQHQAATNDHDLSDLYKICKLYNFKNMHLFDAHHHQLFSTDSAQYPEGLMQRIDAAVTAEADRLWIVDASAASDDKQTLLFYYVPIVKEGQRVGMVLVQENFEKVQNILRETTGMGSTGESYIVGDDYKMRSLSRFLPDKPPGAIVVRTDAALNSFQQEPGRGIVTDYRGERALSVYRLVDIADLHWAIISEIDLSEAMAPINSLRNYLIGITLFILLFIVVVTYFVSNAIARPILQLREIIVTLSKGMMPPRHHQITSSDEVGQMAHAIDQLTEGLERTTAFAKEIGGGNFNTTFTTLSEHDTLGMALLRMRDELHSFNERELRVARERAAALMEGQENERRRIIKDLHDGVGQLLTAIRMRVEALEGNAEWKDEVKGHINATIAEVKRISYNVMPQALVDFGLEAALKGLCDTVKKYAAFTIDFRYIKEYDHTLNFEVSTAVFRIAQEGLNNIVKHAAATHVNLHLLDKEDELYLLLEDNGRGFDTAAVQHNAGQGLRNIQERAKLLDGSAEIHSLPGEGTVVEVHIPVV
ncbi:sensor histidine kinase [Chryseolinea lacunae]|uniref:histidine kinase n=1 Tax=Chryseolinea lacunae TaxID=2801331 RepID=A0ABS1KUM2_9BACT|nr:sensor histidine kinase [Chryseolinea lacunae]MBL0743170.1 HAMP domain-containing protein [Chryseolinea lacunae]